MCEGDCADCFRTFAKVFLIIVNIIFWLAGLLMLAFGIALTVAPAKVLSFFMVSGIDFRTFSNLSGGQFDEIVKACGIFMIILGGVVAIIAFFGFFGACCENKCMLVTYAVFLIIIVLAEVALIIFAAVYPTQFSSVGKQATIDSFKSGFTKDAIVYSNNTIDYSQLNDVENAWTFIQFAFGCCGVNGYTDYQNFTWNRCSQGGVCAQANRTVPVSCCALNTPGFPNTTSAFKDVNQCLTNPSNGNYTNQNSCIDTIDKQATAFILQYSKIAIGIAAGIVGLELILIAFAFVMCGHTERSGKFV